jgi:hypothetical protein
VKRATAGSPAPARAKGSSACRLGQPFGQHREPTAPERQRRQPGAQVADGTVRGPHGDRPLPPFRDAHDPAGRPEAAPLQRRDGHKVGDGHAALRRLEQRLEQRAVAEVAARHAPHGALRPQQQETALPPVEQPR